MSPRSQGGSTMKRRVIGLSMAVALLASTCAGVAMAQDFDTQGNYESRQSRDRDRFQRKSLDGCWIAEGRDAELGRDRGGFRGGRMRGMVLPGIIEIDQQPGVVRISDARSGMLQEIQVDRRFYGREGDRSDPRDQGRFDSRAQGRFGRRDESWFDGRSLLGQWRGSALVVESTGSRGGFLSQILALRDRGRTLVVRTRGRSPDSGNAVEFTRVYHRA